MEYWVYENWINKYIRIHLAKCSFCNDGDGAHRNPINKYGRWLGPYDNIKEAEIVAMETGIRKISKCLHCL